MTETHVVHALLEKRARLMGEIKSAQFRLSALQADLYALDNVIRMFKADYEPDNTVKRTFGKNSAGLRKGVATRTALEILRETEEAISTPDLAVRVLLRLGKTPDKGAALMLVKAIQGNFSRRKDGIVVFDRSTYPGRWQLAHLAELSANESG